MSKYHVPRCLTIALPTIFVTGGVFCLVFYWPWITRPSVGPPRHALPHSIEGRSIDSLAGFDAQFIGHSQEVITTQFGPPTTKFSGHYGNPPLDYRRTYPEAHTHVYTTPAGSLYLSFCQQRGRWVCFAANWLPEGAVF